MKSLRGQLILTIAAIMIVMQSISIAWVWHESQEQIEILTEHFLSTTGQNLEGIEKDLQEEIEETIVALLLPAFITIFASIVLIILAVSRLTRPLSKLSQEIETRTPYNLNPLAIHNASTEVMTVEQTINRLLLRLENGLENERRFTADVAHELRTPLAGLRLNLELMQQQNIPQAAPLINRIDQMVISIEQLLQLARASHKILKGHGQKIDLIEDVIIPMQQEWEEDSTNTTYETIWDIPAKANIIGDSSLIYLLLRNLLENIRNYASQSKQIIIRITQSPQSVTLQVLDEGPGVPEEKLTHLTQRFTRLDQTRKGSGLGLNIVNRIVQIHQGELQIRNRKDKTGLEISIIFHPA